MQQKAVLQINGPVIILAGAGSGKTGALTVRIAHMIEQGIRPWNILAITFTNKAAQEMRERLDLLVPGNNVFVGTFHSFGLKFLVTDTAHDGLVEEEFFLRMDNFFLPVVPLPFFILLFFFKHLHGRDRLQTEFLQPRKQIHTILLRVRRPGLFGQLIRTLQRYNSVEYQCARLGILCICTEKSLPYKLVAVISLGFCQGRFRHTSL